MSTHRADAKAQILKELNREYWRPSVIKSLLKGVRDKSQPKRVKDKEVLEAFFYAARMYKTSISNAMARNKIKSNILARQLVQHYFYDKGVHPTIIGSWTGHDRVTVLHSYRLIEQDLSIGVNKDIIEKVDKLKRLMNGE